MSASGVFLFIAFLAGVATIVLWPLIQSRISSASPTTAPSQALTAVAQLKAAHEAILTALRDLDFDYQTDKLAEADYRLQREALMQQGIETLKLIDAQQSDIAEALVWARRNVSKA